VLSAQINPLKTTDLGRLEEILHQKFSPTSFSGAVLFLAWISGTVHEIKKRPALPAARTFGAIEHIISATRERKHAQLTRTLGRCRCHWLIDGDTCPLRNGFRDT
jgi:hypothetical protein